MAYHNRLPHLKYTLQTYRLSEFKDFEVVIVDDFSSSDQSPSLLLNQFNDMPITVVTMKDVVPEKTYSNPCVPFNVGFGHCRGDKIIIQNPECCHAGDVMTFTDLHLTEANYLSFHCFAANNSSTMLLRDTSPGQIDLTSLQGQWYNHAVKRPVGYHFAAAISKTNLCELNGFDERYAEGECYDDDEFFRRIKKKGLHVQFIDNPYVIHQYHTKDKPFDMEKVKRNETLYRSDDNIVVRANNNLNVCGI